MSVKSPNHSHHPTSWAPVVAPDRQVPSAQAAGVLTRWASLAMHKIVTIAFLCGAFFANAYGRVSNIASIPSPNGAYAASMRLIPAKDLGQQVADSTLPDTNVAVILLHDARSNKKLHQLAIPDSDDTDDRNSIELSWSPDGRVLVVQVQIGQLSQFTLYRIVSGRLMALEEFPTPKALAVHSEHQKSRGAIFIRNWTRPDTFIAIDTVSDAQYTYRITKQWKLQTIASKPIEP
jgi:hypothetical protein